MGTKIRHPVFVIFIVLGMILLVIASFCMIVNLTSRDYIYRTEVGSHIENAYYSADPNTMRTELMDAKQGMQNLGLTDNMYGAWLPWDLTPDRQMKWQYKHIDSILTRIDEFESWEASQKTITGGQLSSSQQMQDVYTQKLDNVRKFIKDDDWSDWIAHDAFAYNKYFFTSVVGVFFLIGGLIVLMGSVFIHAAED
jgi:hypothetical protein